MTQNRVAVGDVVMVRLALLDGMSEDEPSDDEMDQLRLVRSGDARATDKLLKARRASTKNPDLTAETLSEEFWLHPRKRQASVQYVDRSGGGVEIRPSGAPGKLKPATTGSINVEVKTVGSTVMQPAIGHYPIWAQETFRLTSVPFYDEEPEDHQDQHVAFPVPDEDADAKLKSKKK